MSTAGPLPRANSALRSKDAQSARRAAPKATTKLRRGLTTARSACDVVANTAVRNTEDFQ